MRWPAPKPSGVADPALAIRPAGDATAPAFPRDALARSIPDRFAEQVALGPDRLAVKHGDEALTYAALDRLANRVAHAVLDAAGDAPEPVVLLLGQGVGLVAAILGVLKTGKLYVPLDPSFPRARLADQVEDSGARLVLSSTRSAAVARAVRADARVLDVDALGDGRRDDPRIPVPPDAGAYVYYTSGSTGRPKGVLDTHVNVLHNVMRYTNTLGIGPADRLTLLQGPSFSGAVSSLFGALLNGAAVFPFDVRAEGPERIAAWLARERLTIYHSVPALFRRVAASEAALPALRLVRLEGDRASPRDVELFRRRFARGVVLVNGLGATECGIVRQLFVGHDAPAVDGVVPVGYPVEDMDVSLLDDAGAAVPTGEVGEIAVASRYLARGYWRRPDLTAAAFRVAPGDGERRVYRTGDLGRLRPDGCLEHLGRKDFELKVGGQRVDLVEVEAALLDLPGVDEAAASTREGPDGEARLVAYLVPDRDPRPTVSALRRELARRLPAHVIPSAFVRLERLPLDANAKVDRRALPGPPAVRPDVEAAYLSPRSALEQVLVEIWQDVLGVRPVGIRDDFFDLGGSSLLAVRMAEEVGRRLGRRLPASALLDGSTIEWLAGAMDRQDAGPDAGGARIRESGLRPLFFLHGDYERGGLYCVELAKRLGDGPGLHVLPPDGLDGDPIADSYRAMARRRLDAVRAVQPAGPYRLGGVCNGGLVALELARLLLDAGERVERLVVVGATAMSARWTPRHGPIGALGWWMRRGPVDRYDAFLARVLYWDSLSTRGRARLLVKAPGGLARRLVRRPVRTAASATPADGRRLAYRRLDRDYSPAPYPGPVTVLWPREDIERFSAARWWRVLAREVTFELIPGDHVTSLTRHVDALADRLRHALA